MAKHSRPNPVAETMKAVIALPFVILTLGVNALLN